MLLSVFLLLPSHFPGIALQGVSSARSVNMTAIPLGCLIPTAGVLFLSDSLLDRFLYEDIGSCLSKEGFQHKSDYLSSLQGVTKKQLNYVMPKPIGKDQLHSMLLLEKLSRTGHPLMLLLLTWTAN